MSAYLGVVAIVFAVLLVALVSWAFRRAVESQPDPLVDRCIAQKGVNLLTGKRRHYVGFDPDLRASATARRELEAARRLTAHRSVWREEPKPEAKEPVPFRKSK